MSDHLCHAKSPFYLWNISLVTAFNPPTPIPIWRFFATLVLLRNHFPSKWIIFRKCLLNLIFIFQVAPLAMFRDYYLGNRFCGHTNTTPPFLKVPTDKGCQKLYWMITMANWLRMRKKEPYLFHSNFSAVIRFSPKG